MNKLFAIHKKMYDIRWNGGEGNLEQLEKELSSLAKLEDVSLEKINEMQHQLYIPPYQNHLLPDYLKNSHGGKREGAGRPSLGITKKVSLTLPDEIWKLIENRKENEGLSQSQTLRLIIEESFHLSENTSRNQEKV